MGSDTARLYAVCLALLVFFVAWAAIAAHPWTGPEPAIPRDPRARAVAARQAHLVARARVARHVLERRWTTYHRRMTARLAEIARRTGRPPVARPMPAPPVVVWAGGADPVTWTRSS